MSVMSTLLSARALVEGRAQRRCAVRHVHLVKKPIVLVGYQLAGEPFSLAAVAVGRSEKERVRIVCPEPRNVSLGLGAFADLASVLLPMIDEAAAAEQAPQLVVPNPATLSLLSRWGRRFVFLPGGDKYDVPAEVRRLARLLMFFGRHGRIAGQQMVVCMSDVLAQHWATGQSALENQQLASFDAWIEPPKGLTGSEAAARAESTEIGPVASPAHDDMLDPLVEAFNEGVRSGQGAGSPALSKVRKQIEQHWHAHLDSAFATTLRCLRREQRFVEAEHAAARFASDAASFRYEIEQQAKIPHMRARAGIRQLIRERQILEERIARLEAECLFDDPLLQVEAVVEGNGLVGEVTNVDWDKTDISPTTGRALTRPRITLVCQGLLLPEGSELCIASAPKLVGEIEKIKPGKAGQVEVIFMITGGFRNGAPPKTGVTLFLVPQPPDFVRRPKIPVNIPRSHKPDEEPPEPGHLEAEGAGA